MIGRRKDDARNSVVVSAFQGVHDLVSSKVCQSYGAIFVGRGYPVLRLMTLEGVNLAVGAAHLDCVIQSARDRVIDS